MSLDGDLTDLRREPIPPDKAGRAWRMELTPDHADVETGAVDESIHQAVAAGDWSGVLRHFGLDPQIFDVDGDSIRMSSWQQSKRLENGDRDEVWLYSYRARFKRITDRVSESDVESLRDRIHRWKPLIRKTPGSGLGPPAAFYVGWADWQAYKGSIATLSDRVLDSIEQCAAQVKALRKVGRNIESLCIANMGDPIEGCMGAYDSQLFTVSGTKRQQLNAVLDLWATGLRALAPVFDDVLFVSVLSNHGEWTRPPGASTKPLTSDSDSADGFLAETLRRVLSERDDMRHVRWSIPHDQMVTCEDIAGVQVGFTHGHKMPGSAKELDWLRAQSLRLRAETGAEPQLWMTAHRHHLDLRDFGAFWRIQHPTVEVAASKWFTDATGLWSTPGTLTCLIGRHEQAGPIGWSDLAVLPCRTG